MDRELLELKRALEDVAPLVEAALWLGSEEGRQQANMMGVGAVAAIHHHARELVGKSLYWSERFGGPNISIEQIDEKLRVAGADKEGREVGQQIRMMNAIRKALAANIVRAARRSEMEVFAGVLADLEKVDS